VYNNAEPFDQGIVAFTLPTSATVESFEILTSVMTAASILIDNAPLATD